MRGYFGGRVEFISFVYGDSKSKGFWYFRTFFVSFILSLRVG